MKLDSFTDWSEKTVLITGGTGSFGRKFCETILRECNPKKLIIFSRDELKQYTMRTSGFDQPNIRFFIGDVRDRDRLRRAFCGVDIVVHAAALKQIEAAEYNPLEAIRTNVLGAANVIDAAIDLGVERVIALSTDKAANPINLYGATKLCSDKLFVAANAYSGNQPTRFSVVRYGNVFGSRGSVVPFFLRERHKGVLTITDPRMTRFWITLEQGVRFVIQCLETMHGGETFVPKLPSMRVVDLAAAIAPECDIKVTGIRPGEKLHEVMIPRDVAHHTIEFQDYYVIEPRLNGWTNGDGAPGKCCSDGFAYSSDKNDWWLSVDDMAEMVRNYQAEENEIGKAPLRAAVYSGR